MASRRKPKARCTGVNVRPESLGSPLVCEKCKGEVRVKKDGTAYSHYPSKSPVDKSDPRHAAYIKKTYGITGEQYEELLAWQGGVCFICQKRPAKMRLAVDHDHKSGHVRGLLCKRCNKNVLGGANDNVENLLRAASYLHDPPALSCFGVAIKPDTKLLGP